MDDTEPLRVLNTMNDPRTGGPQLRSLAVAGQLRKRGIETEFLLPDGDDGFASMATNEGFVVHRPGISRVNPPKNIGKNARYLFGFPLAVSKVHGVLKDQNIDAVHTNMSLSFCPAVAASISSVPLAWHFNDTLVPTPAKQIATRAAMSLADEIVVASESVAEYYFSDRVDTTTIYSPVDVDEFDPQIVSPATDFYDSSGSSKDPIVIGTVGNVNPIKGHEYFIRAIATIKEQFNRPVIAPIVGAKLDSREEYYEDLVDLCEELDVSDNVVFLGKRDDVPELMAAFDAFVLSSVAEACPMVVLEAMAMECPVVATRVGGVPEQITDGKDGWLVPSENPTELANAVIELLRDENESTRRAANARERVCSTFSLEHCVDRHEALYRSLV
ncbi:glycosyltransferase family 4 protein [Halosimplex salinum]|uniref:glycosyltransferase family 4 protein n=1 Tax=Halosimplex salinum TaxID=1710538 RepID=UPI000F46E719|nr:glycosyltransferase family 4 protein [Halosimplex salinum]